MAVYLYNTIPFCTLQRMELAHQLGDRLSEARAICNIGNALRLTGSLTEAQKCYLENLECSREIGDLPGESIALLNLGTITESLGDLDKAASWYTMVRAWGCGPLLNYPLRSIACWRQCDNIACLHLHSCCTNYTKLDTVISISLVCI